MEEAFLLSARQSGSAASSRGILAWTRSAASRFVFRFEALDQPGRVLEMEGLRGLAVLLVFFVHFGQNFRPYAGGFFPVLDFLVKIGHSGVDLFFLLSGYLIYGILLDKKVSTIHFLRRRAQRIYPAFLAVFGVYLILQFALPSLSRLPHPLPDAAIYLVLNLLMLPGILDIYPLITVAWSLSYEFLSYLTFPVLVRRFGMARWRAGVRVSFWLALALLFTAFTAVMRGVDFRAVRFSPGHHIRLVMFFGGALIYEYRRSQSWLPYRRWQEFTIVLSVVACWLELYFHPGGQVSGILVALTLFVGYGWLVAFSITSGGWTAVLLRWPPLRWLGNMSYSYYLIHALPVVVAHRVLASRLRTMPPPGAIVFLLLPALMVCSLVVGATLYLLVERPLSILPRAHPVTPGPLRAHAAVGENAS